MAFDFYLYRSRLGHPDFDEAVSLVDVAEDAALEETLPEEKEGQEAIAHALLQINPQLERFELDHSAIAQFLNISLDEAKIRFDYIQLNTPEGELATSIDIFKNHVAITIPYWYKDSEASVVFDKADAYAKAVSKLSGYFAFDPQTGRAFDPLKEGLIASALYEGTSEMVANMKPGAEILIPKKPWWKFW